MTRRSSRLLVATVAALLVGSLAAGGAAAHGRNSPIGDLIRAGAATARYLDVRKAEADGYALPPAPAPLHECIANLDGPGAMGFHYINGSLLDTTLDPRKPEALVYAPDRSGRLHLAALEYVVFQEPWVAEHGDAMPRLFGQDFMPTGSPNRYDIPAFFALHVWLWKPNPNGLFEPFNRRVSCGEAGPTARAASARTGAARYACGVHGRLEADTRRRT